jgi:hypothetical protein
LKFNQLDKDIFCRDNLSVSVFYALGKFHIKFCDITKRSLIITNTLQVPIKDGESYKKFTRSGNQLFWDNDIDNGEIEIFSKLLITNKDNKGDQKHFYNQLKKAILDINQKADVPKQYNINVIPLYCQIEDEERLKILSVLETRSNKTADLTIFALPLIQNNEQLLTHYPSRVGDHFGIIPLTLFDINSYRRLQKIFLKTILEFNDDKCSYCGGVMQQTENGSICNNCKLIVTETICPHEDCKHKYKYTRYSITEDKLRVMQSIDDIDFFNQDSLFQYKDIVKMDIRGNLTPVCPNCENK